jgi:FKBP-type peptidyl-prolyl cis-trans isomerase SlyD
MLIQKNTVVSLRYTMKDNKGEIIDDIMNSSPIEYLHGSGDIMSSLESSVEGLTEGTEKSFEVHDKVLNKPLYFEVVIDKIRSATDEEIEKRRVIKTDCGPDCCC